MNIIRLRLIPFYLDFFQVFIQHNFVGSHNTQSMNTKLLLSFIQNGSAVLTGLFIMRNLTQEWGRYLLSRRKRSENPFLDWMIGEQKIYLFSSMFLGVRGHCSSQSHVTITFQNLQSVQPPETNWGDVVDFCGWARGPVCGRGDPGVGIYQNFSSRTYVQYIWSGILCFMFCFFSQKFAMLHFVFDKTIWTIWLPWSQQDPPLTSPGPQFQSWWRHISSGGQEIYSFDSFLNLKIRVFSLIWES